jgi:hypothetical protein
MSRPSPENAMVARSNSATAHSTPATPPCGFQPSAKPVVTIIVTPITSTAITASVFPASSTERGNGEAPSRLSTP